MGNSVSDTATASRSALGEEDRSQEVPDEANESISAWLDSPPFTQKAPPAIDSSSACGVDLC